MKLNPNSTDSLFGAPPPLKYYKLFPEASAPEWGTEHAACFDLRACLIVGVLVTKYTVDNEKQIVNPAREGTAIYVSLEPHDRMMVPTGLMFDIPTGYSVRLHSRSGFAVKQGVVLANHEGVVDSDYIDPTFMVVTNNSNKTVKIYHGDRLAQGEMMPDIAYDVTETPEKPQPKSDRKGGFGSTGVK
jgi:dUTP pyrophosphatase